MKRFLSLSVLPLVLLAAIPGGSQGDRPDVVSEVRTTEVGERILVHTVHVDAPLEAVWAAHTTAEGYAAWAAPVAEVDLRVGGTIRAHYAEGAEVGDPGTTVLHIVNYVPNELLTLRAEPDPSWPEVLRADADRLSNVVLFDPLDDGSTRIRSYGIGYGDATEYEQLLEFFAQANTGLYERLVRHLEREAGR